MPTNPLSLPASSSVESHHRHFLAEMESGSVILCCRAHILVTVMNVFGGLSEDRLAFVEGFLFPSNMGCSVLATIWVISGSISNISFTADDNNS